MIPAITDTRGFHTRRALRERRGGGESRDAPLSRKNVSIGTVGTVDTTVGRRQNKTQLLISTLHKSRVRPVVFHDETQKVHQDK